MQGRDSNKQWLKTARWGVFQHFLHSYSPKKEETLEMRKNALEAFNERVNSFDVEGLANQLKYIGAKYYFITIGQCCGHYCSPNPVYDEIVGSPVSLCSERDLVMDLANELAKHDIRMGTYIPCSPSTSDPTANKGFGILDPEAHYGWTRGIEHQTKWESCIKYWSEKFGDKIFAWWIDGVGMGGEAFSNPEEPNIHSLCRALRAGNPNSILAFNGGVMREDGTRNVNPYIWEGADEDYTAGEMDVLMPSPGINHLHQSMFAPEQWGNEVLHVLSYLGSWWGDGDTPRMNDDLVSGITKMINDHHGSVTWDVPVSKNGLIDQSFITQLYELGQRLK